MYKDENRFSFTGLILNPVASLSPELYTLYMHDNYEDEMVAVDTMFGV